MLIEVRTGNARDDCLCIFRHNFLIICQIFKLFFSNFLKDKPYQLEVLGSIRGPCVIRYREITQGELKMLDCILSSPKLGVIVWCMDRSP